MGMNQFDCDPHKVLNLTPEQVKDFQSLTKNCDHETMIREAESRGRDAERAGIREMVEGMKKKEEDDYAKKLGDPENSKDLNHELFVEKVAVKSVYSIILTHLETKE